MSILDIFKKKPGVLTGEVMLHDLPPHRFYSVSVTLFRVRSKSSAPPWGGNPPTAKWKDTTSVKAAEEPDDTPLRFRLQRAGGYYYVGVSVIVFMERGDRVSAQVERFFPMSNSCEIKAETEQQLVLQVSWPDTPFDELQSYGTIRPRKR